MTVHDIVRLRTTLGNPALARIVERLADRLARRGDLSGSLGLRDSTPDERNAIDRLLGRTSSTGAMLSLAKLEEVLRHARIADSLADAVAALAPDALASRAQLRGRELAWEHLESDFARATPDQPLDEWRMNVVRTGLLRRLAHSDPAKAKRYFDLAVRVLARLPSNGVLLPVLAAEAAGDSHALDPGAPVGTLVVRALQMRTGSAVDDRRQLWAAFGVELDPLSAPVLVLGLRAISGGPLAAVLGAHADAGEPYHLTLRALRLDLDLSWYAGRRVFVCENPAVVGLAADRLGARCPALICTSGQPRGAARALLMRFAQSGAKLQYHGDFDWPGILIASEVMTLSGATPWRLTQPDYVGAPDGPPLEGARVETPWDPSLAEAMQRRGTAVHEEQVASLLLDDLDAG